MTSPFAEFAGQALEKACPDCPTDEQRAANAAEWKAWHGQEEALYAAFEDQWDRTHRDQMGITSAWENSPEYKAFYQRDDHPETIPEAGCFYCEYTGIVPSEQGRILRDFIRRCAKS